MEYVDSWMSFTFSVWFLNLKPSFILLSNIFCRTFFSWCLLLFIICFIASLYGVPPLINMYLKTFPSFVSLNLPIDGFEIPRVEGLLFIVPLHPFVPSLNWMRVVFSLSQTPWVIDWSKLIYYCSKIDLVIPDFYVPFSGKLTKVNGVK